MAAAADKKGKSFSVEMSKAKETKGTWAFEAGDDTSPVTNLYFKKPGLDKINKAERIRVTIEEIPA